MDINDPEYETVFTALSISQFGGYLTRTYEGTYSCRMSLLYYIIISMTPKKPNEKPINYIERLYAIARLCLDDRLLSTFIRGNSPREIGCIPIHSERDEVVSTIFDPTAPSSTIYPMALVNITDPTKYQINHFFAIVKLGDNFFIVSSYGCDVLYSSQSMVQISRRDFDKFIAAINIHNNSKIDEYMTNFFFPPESLKPTAYHIDDDTKKKTSYPSQVGVTTELEFYQNYKHQFFYCPRLIGEVNRIIGESDAVLGAESKSGGRRRKKSVKGRTKGNKRNKKTKRDKRTKRDKKTKRNKKN